MPEFSSEEWEEYEEERRKIMSEEFTEGELFIKEVEEITIGFEEPEGQVPWAFNKEPLKLIPISAREFAAKKYPPIKWLVRDLFTAQSAVSMIVGESGSFKTWIAIEIAKSISLGVPFFDFQVPERHKVVYFNLEMPEAIFQERVLGREMKEDFEGDLQYFHVPSRPIDLMNQEEFVEAISAVYAQAPCVTIFDTLSKLHTSSAAENDNDKMTELVMRARQIAEIGQGLVITLHHTSKYNPEFPKPKLERIRGASGVRDNMMNILFLSSKKTKDGTFYVEGELVKSWSGEVGMTFSKQLVVEKDLDTGGIARAEWIDYDGSGEDDVVYDEIIERLHFFFDNPNAYWDGIPMTIFRGTPKSRKNPNGDLSYAALDKLAGILEQMEGVGLVRIDREKKEGGRKLIRKGEAWD